MILVVIILLGITSSTSANAQVISPQGLQQSSQNLESPLIQNTPEGLNTVNNLANFDLSVKDKQSLTEFFNKCPFGVIIYKVNGQFFVYCFQTPLSGKLFGLHGQPVTTEVKIITKHITDSSNGNNHEGKKGNHNGGGNGNGNNGGPDGDCLFNASLPKCDPDEDGNCPDDFNLNEDGNCFPDHHETGCPEGTHGVDDDETGQCYDNDEVDCPSGMTLRENGKSCGYTDEVCEDGNTNPNCDEQQQPIPLEESEPKTCESGSVLENGICAALDSNCGGEPCTASQKEDSTTSDPILGKPDIPTTETETDTDITVPDDSSDTDTTKDTKNTDTDTDSSDTDTEDTEDNSSSGNGSDDDESEDSDSEDSDDDGGDSEGSDSSDN